MTDQEPKLIIDTDWKNQAQAERERLAAASKTSGKPAIAPEAGTAPGGAPGAEEKIGFQDLVSLLATQALNYMGAFPDPRTGKAMIAPEYAKLHIDLLGILDDKTRGNLSEAEKTMLTRTLQELRAEFVELVRAVDKAVAEGKIAPMQQGGAPGGAPGGIVTPPSAGGGRIIGA